MKLYIPIAGYYYKDNLYYKNSLGYYWSSSSNSGSAKIVYYLFFNSISAYPPNYGSYYYGFPIRNISINEI